MALLGLLFLQTAKKMQIIIANTQVDEVAIITAKIIVEKLELYYSQVLMENSEAAKLP